MAISFRAYSSLLPFLKLKRIEPLASARKGAKTIVTNRLTGNFPGSPVDLQFVFELDGNKIVSLEIHP